MFGQAAAGWNRPVPADVLAVQGALCDLRVVLPLAPVLRVALPACGADFEPPRGESP